MPGGWLLETIELVACQGSFDERNVVTGLAPARAESVKWVFAKKAVTSDATVTNTTGEILTYLYCRVLNFQLPMYLLLREARDDRKPDHI